MKIRSKYKKEWLVIIKDISTFGRNDIKPIKSLIFNVVIPAGKEAHEK